MDINRLERAANKKPSIVAMMIIELILFYIAYLFFSDGKTIEAMLVVMTIELRHLRYVVQGNNHG